MRPSERRPWQIACALGALCAIAPGASQLAAQAPPDALSGTARLSGRVISPYAEPLHDAMVTLVLAGEDGADRQRWSARTTVQGSFDFERLPAGTYRVSAQKPGFTDLELAPPGVVRPGGQHVVLAGGEHPPGIELVLRRAGSLAGIILRSDGTPAPDTEVSVAFGQLPDGAFSIVATTTSTPNGRYEIPNLPAGEFTVAARPGPWVSDGRGMPAAAQSATPSLYPGVPEWTAGEPVRVFAGVATEGIDVWLGPAPQRFTVAGRVLHPQGRALREIAIEYSDLAHVRSGVWIVSDPDGYFTIEGVPPGPLLMLARAESADGPVAAFASTELAVGPAEDVRLMMRPPGAVTGRVIIEGTLPAQQPALRVSLVHTLIKVSALYPQEDALVQADGRFHLPRALGEYRFAVSGLPEGWTLERVTRAGRIVADGRITVSNGDLVSGIELFVGPISDGR